MSHNPLGRQTDYVATYSPHLLFPIARADSRSLLGIAGEVIPFYGVDIWTGYELSWLSPQGMPQVAVAEFIIPCSSEFMVESKSFKLYLNSFNQSRFDNIGQVKSTLIRDLSAIVNASVDLTLFQPGCANHLENISSLPGKCLDELPVAIDTYQPHPDYLRVGPEVVTENVYSHLLKTNCPVTGQPDWASVHIGYKGREIHHEGLLRYLVSFREHQDFHEHCVERIFMDIVERCAPESLTVYARYTRRGGLDINPWRSTEKTVTPDRVRLLRQ